METTNAIVKREPKALGPMLALEKIAEHAYRSGMFKRYPNASAAYVVCAFGYELGMSPVAALTSIHCVEGKPVMSGNLMLSLVYSSGTHDVRIKRRDNTGCVIEWKRKSESGVWEVLGESSFTSEDAQRAGLTTKDSWKKYPKAMYFNRAVSDGFKTYCPHLAHGHTLYTPDELGGEINEEGEMVEVVSVKATPKKSPRLDELTALLQETSTSSDYICKHFEVDSLDDLLDKELEAACSLLRVKVESQTEVPEESPVEYSEEKPVTKRGKKK